MNTFRLARRLGEHVVVIFAEYCEDVGLYGLRVTIDGELWDERQSEDVMKEAADIFAEAFVALVADRVDTALLLPREDVTAKWRYPER